MAQIPTLWQTRPVPRPGGGSISPEVTVKLRMSCLLCHLCAEFSEYLTVLLPPPLLCHTPTPTGLEILPGFHLFSTPVLLIGGTAQGFSACCCPCLSAVVHSGMDWLADSMGSLWKKHNPMQMSKARSAFPPRFVV